MTCCPVHPQELLRREVGPDGYPTTGFCLKCLKHYPLCRSVLYMTQCQLVSGHEGRHDAGKGQSWDEGAVERSRDGMRGFIWDE